MMSRWARPLLLQIKLKYIGSMDQGIQGQEATERSAGGGAIRVASTQGSARPALVSRIGRITPLRFHPQ